MNHWLLVGRDLMWFFLAYAPVCAGLFVGHDAKARELPDDVLFPLLLMAFGGQTIIIAALYFGWIK